MAETSHVALIPLVDDLWKSSIPLELFVTESNQPMQFSISPTTDTEVSEGLKKLKTLIESGGGMLAFHHSVIGHYTIPLIRKGEVRLEVKDDLFKLKFILDCAEGRKLVDLNLYRANKSVYEDDVDVNQILNGAISWSHLKRKKEIGDYVSDFSGDDDGGRSIPSSRSANTKKAYGFGEEKAMLNYIVSKKLYGKVKGISLWKDMESAVVCSGRSWQSMKERYNKKIVTDLAKFDLGTEISNKLLIGNGQRALFVEEPTPEASNEAESNTDYSKETEQRETSPKVKESSESIFIATQETVYVSGDSADYFNNISGDGDNPATNELLVNGLHQQEESLTQSDFANLPQSTQYCNSSEFVPSNPQLLHLSNVEESGVQNETTRPTESVINTLSEGDSSGDILFDLVHLIKIEPVADNDNEDVTELSVKCDDKEDCANKTIKKEVNSGTSRKIDVIPKSPRINASPRRKRNISEQSSSESATSPMNSRLKNVTKSSTESDSVSAVKSDVDTTFLMKSDSDAPSSIMSSPDSTCKRKLKGSSKKRKKRSSKYRTPFTFDEDVAILNFIKKYESYSLVKGVMLWQTMETQNIVKERSWQSLKERFRKRILPNMDLYRDDGLSNEFKNNFFKFAPQKEQIPHKLKKLCKTTRNYTKDEDDLILSFIAKNKRFSKVMGVRLWKVMEHRIEKRSWQSLKNRFLKHILPNLSNYELSSINRECFANILYKKSRDDNSKNSRRKRIVREISTDDELSSGDESIAERKNEKR